MSRPKTPNPNQQSFSCANLLDQLNPKHLLLQLAKQIDWSFFEDEFAALYSHLGKPSKPIRLMAGWMATGNRKQVGMPVAKLCFYPRSLGEFPIYYPTDRQSTVIAHSITGMSAMGKVPCPACR